MVPKTLRQALLVASGAIVLPTIASAAAPVAFGTSYTVDTLTGAINYTCPATMTCSPTPISENGFYQIQLTENATGNTYFQTVVATDSGTGNTFASESFVTTGTTTGGISSQQSMTDQSSGFITATSEMNTGNFNVDPIANPLMTLSQTVADNAVVVNREFSASFGLTQGEIADRNGDGVNEKYSDITLNQSTTPVDLSFNSSFGYGQRTVSESAAGGGATVVDHKLIDIASGVQINAGGSTADQGFAYHFRSGTDVPNAGNAVLNGATVDWVVGDTVDRVLINQTVASAGTFGYERLSDLVDVDGAGPDATESASFSSLANPSPFATFGAGVTPPF